MTNDPVNTATHASGSLLMPRSVLAGDLSEDVR
jgi:hypothetical protein